MERRTTGRELFGSVGKQPTFELACRNYVGGEMAARHSFTRDPRNHRTRADLHKALALLIREKDYEEIAVREILERADVGRSTFYAHFEDKDALLASTVRDMFAEARSRLPLMAEHYENLVAFGLPLFEHVDRHRRDGGSQMAASNRAALHEHLRAAVSGWIAEAANAFPVRGKEKGGVSNGLLAEYLASNFVLVLHWWLDRQPMLSAQEAHEVFRELVTPTLAAVW